MAKANGAFTFNQHGDFETNLVSFGTHLAGIDGLLGTVMSQRLIGLRDGTVSQAELWTSLFQAVQTAKAVATQPAAPASVTAPAPAAVAGHNAVSGWLLE